jgi:heme ABC exporter ATP-binding subunit CcmA
MDAADTVVGPGVVDDLAQPVVDGVGQPVVDLHDAVVVLGRFPALAGVTLAIDPGEIVLARGPNGAGKTTLLRLCAGRVGLTRGRGAVLGRDLATERRSVRPYVGLLGHRNGLYLDLTVTENVGFWAAVSGASPSEVRPVLERLGLDGRLADLPARRLSAGQMRRTALACFIVRRAHLWLLDEPHTGLDTGARDEVDALIRQAADSGVTVLFASHELERAQSLATRVVDLAGGIVVEAGAA